jgi:hypothetical protein
MQQRRGGKAGWIGGWLGGFLWLCLLSILWLAQGRIAAGLSALSLFAVAVLAIFALAPWKHPETKYWKLLLPIYAILAASIGLLIWGAGGFDKLGLSWPSLLLLMPLFIPFATTGTRRWKDGNA